MVVCSSSLASSPREDSQQAATSSQPRSPSPGQPDASVDDFDVCFPNTVISRAIAAGPASLRTKDQAIEERPFQFPPSDDEEEEEEPARQPPIDPRDAFITPPAAPTPTAEEVSCM